METARKHFDLNGANFNVRPGNAMGTFQTKQAKKYSEV
jgi:hypothetical protein